MSAKGWKIDWRHAGPSGSERIGAIVLTSCAWQATVTRSLCRSRVMSSEPTTTASSTVYASSLSRGATVHSPGVSLLCSALWYQTFHSSKEMSIVLERLEGGADVVGRGDHVAG